MKGQRPGVIPAWGNAPGNEAKKFPSATGAIHRCNAVGDSMVDDVARWAGPSALIVLSGLDLGRCPRLVSIAPLALVGTGLDVVVSSATMAEVPAVIGITTPQSQAHRTQWLMQETPPPHPQAQSKNEPLR